MPSHDKTAIVDAERRLRQALGRQPTVREIADLRLAEQALGLEQDAFVKARQLVAVAGKLRDRSTNLIGKVREGRQWSRGTRKKSRHLRRKNSGKRPR